MAMLEILGSLLAAGGAGAGAWRASPLARARRRAARAIRPLERESERWKRSQRRWHAKLAPAAREFAAHHREARLAAIPIEALREAGATNVRWSTLREAGFESLADVARARPSQLASIRGIGEASARKIAAAARRLLERARADPPALPRPDLHEPGAGMLAAKSLALLEARDAAGPAPRRLAERADALRARAARVRGKVGFAAWIRGPWRRSHAREAIAEADAIASAARELRASGLVEEARAGRATFERLRKQGGVAADPERRFRDRYAECCALLEELFAELGLRRGKVVASGQGGLTDEVARRVEAFPLRSASMRSTLRRYQEFGAKYLLAQERTILGDEMGLGKTVQALAAMTHRWEEDRARRFFVVAPAGLLVNWGREVAKHTPLAAHRLHGDDLEAALERWVREGGVAITSYDTLRNVDLGASLEATGGSIDLAVVDEAHFVKNPAAGRTQAVRRLLARSDLACLLSGTPMENHPGEFLHLIDAIRPEDGAELRSAELDLDAAAGSVLAFHEAVSHTYLRRNQEDVLTELPDKIEVEEWVELGLEERRAYREEVLDGSFMGMRRAATIGGGTTVSAKLERLAELLEDHRESGRKVLVFSFFLDVLAAVARRFDVVGTVQGSLKPEDKQELCDRFQAAEGHAILALQIHAGGQGLNLQSASAVVLMEPQTKPSTESQAIARAHRMGQTQRVLVHRLLARATCDESLLLVLAGKAALFEAYARRSLVKEASGQATETSIARAVVDAERARIEAAEDGAEPGRSELESLRSDLEPERSDDSESDRSDLGSERSERESDRTGVESTRSDLESARSDVPRP